MAKCYIKIYYDWTEVTATLSDAEKGRLVTALVNYARSGEGIELSGAERHLFPMFQAQIERDNISYDAKIKNGKNGGAPFGNKNATTKNNLKQPKTTENKQEEDKDKDKDKDNILSPLYIPPKSFTRPTVVEVKAYCDERKNNVNPQTFVDFYSSKGWKVGAQPMKDWKACVRTWEQRDTQPKARSRPKMSVQRKYTDAEINSFGHDILEDI